MINFHQGRLAGAGAPTRAPPTRLRRQVEAADQRSPADGSIELHIAQLQGAVEPGGRPAVAGHGRFGQVPVGTDDELLVHVVAHDVIDLQ